MDTRAIPKALIRLQGVTNAIAGMKELDKVAAEHLKKEGVDTDLFIMRYRAEWHSFVVSWKGIYTTLKKAAHGNPQTMQWYGARAAERKKDPLLNFLFLARDDDSHTLNYSICPKINWRVPVTKGQTIAIKFSDDKRVVEVQGASGPPELSKPFMTLDETRQRDEKITVRPPAEWRGMLIFQATAAEVAFKVRDDAAELITAAWRLTQHKPSP